MYISLVVLVTKHKIIKMVSSAGESSNVESKTGVGEVLTKKDDIDNQNLLTKFWNLASLDEEVRISSCIGIVKELKSCQKKVWYCIEERMVTLFEKINN